MERRWYPAESRRNVSIFHTAFTAVETTWPPETPAELAPIESIRAACARCSAPAADAFRLAALGSSGLGPTVRNCGSFEPLGRVSADRSPSVPQLRSKGKCH